MSKIIYCLLPKGIYEVGFRDGIIIKNTLYIDINDELYDNNRHAS